jgi:hypothetical protein
MKKQFTSYIMPSVAMRAMAVVTAGAFLITTLGAAPAEASFWEERAAASARRQNRAPAKPILLAQLPMSQSPLLVDAVRAIRPTVSPLANVVNVGPLWARRAVTPFADVRAVREGKSAGPKVFLVMDAHDVFSAQRNVARFLEHLSTQGKMVVGVEGTTGAFDVERHRELLPKTQQAVLTAHLLKKGFINGPEAFGLTAEKVPTLWGVEDPKLYDANVRAYRDALPLESETHAALQVLKTETQVLASKVFSKQLADLDNEIQAMHENRGDLAKYAQSVSQGNAGSQTRKFLEAKKLEDGLVFPQVEQSRAAFIERVSPRLSSFEMEALIQTTVNFRSGSMGARAYYKELEALAATKGVPLSAYPPFRDYIHYVTVAEGIDATHLMEELEDSEERAYARLADGQALALAQWRRDVRLAERAVQHALTPREWVKYGDRRGALAQMSERAKTLGLSASSAQTLQDNLPTFVSFFEAALARDEALLNNLLAEARRQEATTAVLVVGGFHAPALEKKLGEREISHVVLTPRMSDVSESGAGYLQAFAPTRTPLERLLLGDRLFMNPPSATSVSVGTPSSPFHAAAVALNRATASYGVALADDVDQFVIRWNSQLGGGSPVAVEVQETGGAQVASVTFPEADQTVLVATGGNSNAQQSADLERAVKETGGKVVETDRVGDVPYVLGGKNLSRFVPETLAGVAYLVWLGGSALSPPLLLSGLAAWVIVGGMVVRGLTLLSIYWHGLGHASLARAFGGKSVGTSLREYGERLSLGQLVPFADIFLPGIGASDKAPQFEEPSLSGGQRRITALAGPAANLLAVGLIAPFLSLMGPVGLTDLALSVLAGANLWAAVMSVSDFRTALSGLGRVFACGVIGVVYGGPNPKSELMPEGVLRPMNEGILRTLHRGGQSGGVASVGVRENGHAEFSFFVEKTAKENNRRERLGQLMRGSMTRLAIRAQKAGFGGMRRLVVVGHTRYGTNLAAPVAANAHPHMSSGESDTLHYLGEARRDDKYERPWDQPHDAPALKSVSMTRGVAIAHNGDDNATILYRRGSKIISISNEDDARLSERMTDYKNPAQGDSPQIATRMDRWLTQGSVVASLRLTLLMLGLETLTENNPTASAVLERAPTPSLIKGVMQSQIMDSFSKEVKALNQKHPTASTLGELFRAAGAETASTDAIWDLEASAPFRKESDIDRLKTNLSTQAQSILKLVPWFSELGETQQDQVAERFADLFLKFFFTGDLRRAGIHLLQRADSTSTYGVMAATLLEAESSVWLRQRQPFYLWVSEDGKSVAGSSEAKAFLGAKSGDSLFRYRLSLKNGEVATLRDGRLVIDHIENGRVAEYDLNDMAQTIGQGRWLDLEKSPYVSISEGENARAEERVRQDVEMIPWVNQRLKEDFENPKSNNSLSGEALVGLLVDRLAKRKTSSAAIDLVIVGTEKSYDAGSLFAQTVEKISSLAGRRLNVRVIYGAEFTREDLAKLRDEGFGVDTVVLGLASSGQTANTFYTLESLNAAWRGLMEKTHSVDAVSALTPPHFLVSADIDNPYTEEVLGQGLGEKDGFKARNFVTFPTLDSFHPAEAATVTHKATERLLKEVSTLFAERIAQRSRRWKEGRAPAGMADAVRQMVENGDELDRRIIGLDADGNPHHSLRQSGEKNEIPAQIQKIADRISQAFLESLWATGATALFISVTLLFHATPATLLLSALPNQAFLFSAGLPVLAGIAGVLVWAGAVWKTQAWKWHGLFFVLGSVTALSAGLLFGETLVLGLDALGQSLDKGLWGSRWGALPFPVDVSPVNLLNAVTYIFFFFGFTLGLRKTQGRPLWDRLGGRILVLSDAQHSVSRLSAARWRRMLSHRFGWMGLNSVNESSLGRLTHEEALNSNVRGHLYLQGSSRNDEEATIMNYKQLGGSPNGPGRVWRMGIGHKPLGEASSAYSEGYISLAMKDDSPAGDNLDMLSLQDLLQDAPARDTAGMVLALEVSERMSSLRPLDFVIGMTSSEAKTSTTQQPFAPLSVDEVRGVFGLSPEASVATGALQQTRAAVVEDLPVVDRSSAVRQDTLPDQVDTATPKEPVSKVMAGNSNKPGALLDSGREDLLSLATFLGLSHRATDSMDYVSRVIRLKMSYTPMDIPSHYEAALMLALSLGREASRSHVQLTYENGKMGILPLKEFWSRRERGNIPGWDSLRVVHQLDHFVVSETPVNLGEKTAEVTSSDHRDSLLALAGYLKLSVPDGAGDVTLAEKISEALMAQSEASVQIPGQYEDGLIAVLAHAKDRNGQLVSVFFNNGRENSFPETLETFLHKKNAASSVAWDNYYVTFTGQDTRSFTVFPNPQGMGDDTSAEEDLDSELVEDTLPRGEAKAEVTADTPENPVVMTDVAVQTAQESVPSGERSYRRFIRRVVGNSIQVTMIFLTSILLTSWGDAFVSSVEGAMSRIIVQPEVHDVRLSPESIVPQPRLAIPDTAPRAFVNTKTTPLISFDHNPSAKNRVVGRLGVRSQVKVVERKGSWVFVSEASGTRGWINSRFLQKGEGGRMTVLRNVRVRERAPALRKANLPKGDPLAVLMYQGKWAQVVPMNSPHAAVWVSREYVSEKGSVSPAKDAAKKSSGQNESQDVSSPSTRSAIGGVDGLLGLMGKTVPVLGEIAQRRVAESISRNRPGVVLHRRLMSGARQEFKAGPTRDAANALSSFIDGLSSSPLDQADQQLVLALGYGAVAGESWAQEGAPRDRALYDDYRGTRALLHRGPLSARAGRALTRLARQASRWTVNTVPVYTEGALPVIDLTQAERETYLLNDWAMALARRARGGPAPVVIAHNSAHQARLMALLMEWGSSHPEANLTEGLLASSQWVHVDSLQAGVAQRDEDGALLSLRLGAVLGTVDVDVRNFVAIDIVTGVHSKVVWDRSDVPDSVAVRMIIGLLKGLSLTAPLEDAQGAMRAARKAMTAA